MKELRCVLSVNDKCFENLRTYADELGVGLAETMETIFLEYFCIKELLIDLQDSKSEVV